MTDAHVPSRRLGKTESYDRICSNPEVVSAVLGELTDFGLSAGLERFELPTALTLCREQWTPESGLITAAFKLKRKVVQGFYQSHIDRMYEAVA